MKKKKFKTKIKIQYSKFPNDSAKYTYVREDYSSHRPEHYGKHTLKYRGSQWNPKIKGKKAYSLKYDGNGAIFTTYNTSNVVEEIYLDPCQEEALLFLLQQAITEYNGPVEYEYSGDELPTGEE